MTLALALVAGIAGWTLYASSTRIAAQIQEDVLTRGLVLSSTAGDLTPEGAPVEHKTTGVQIVRVRYGELGASRGTLYQYHPPGANETAVARLLVPEGGQRVGDALLGLISAIMVAVVLAGAGVALWVASQVTRPLERIAEDIRVIALGNLQQRVHVRGSAEIELLVRAINAMARDLSEARETELELSIREREVELAAGVREALLPLATPELPGWELGSIHIASPRFGGDFHDFINLGDQRLGLLVCDVSGHGLPAALIGAAARSWLRAELQRGGDVGQALRRVNAELARDVRRGMYVTALYAVLDGEGGRVQVACAGHKVPLLRFSAADQKLRMVQPEGIALGLDRGPVFDRTLKLVDLELQPGDRLLISNTGPLRLQNAAGEELGEKAFFAQVLRSAAKPTQESLQELRRSLEHFAGGELPVDVSLITATHRG